jgi:hypothetical protein
MDEKGIFLCYATEDSRLAKLLQKELENEYKMAFKIFRAQDYRSIKPGDEWWENIKEALQNYPLTLVLATPLSILKPWINFEAGASIGSRSSLVPICAYGLRIKDLKDLQSPLYVKQALDLHSLDGIRELFRIVAETFDKPWHGKRNLLKLLKEVNSVTKHSPAELVRQAEQMGVSQLLFRRDVKNPDYGLMWKQLVSKCKKSIRIVGWSCMNVNDGASRDAFRELLSKDDRKLEFLVIKADAVEKSNLLNFGPVCNVEHKTLISDFQKGIDDVRKLAEQISFGRGSQIEVRETNWIMSWSAVAVDLDEEDGLIQVENYIYKQNLDSRPLFVVRQTRDGYYQVFKQSIHNMWQAATQVVI